MKKTSFEGVSSDAVNNPVDGMSQVADENQGALPSQTPDQKKTAPVSSKEPEKECEEPKILLDREGDKIRRIRVLCSCGQSIVLDCNYSVEV
ncbi:hypothetical protein N8648_02820 [Verrucomicrobia bacterium]|nr:hypothetical protein [Verrucomicrobiota bacterium]